MKEKLRLLAALQEIDATIVNKTEVIQGIPKKVSSAEQYLKEAQAFQEKQKQQCLNTEKKKKELERTLEDFNEKLTKLKTRTAGVKNNKEYQALLKEIETAEKEKYKVEDSILAAMELLEASYKEVSAADARAAEAKKQVEAFKKELAVEVAAAEKELDISRAHRADIVKAIDAELYDLYFKILEARGGLAVAEAKGERCLGCNMNIPPQLFVGIKKNDRLFQCPQCNRILYWKDDENSQL